MFKAKRVPYTNFHEMTSAQRKAFVERIEYLNRELRIYQERWRDRELGKLYRGRGKKGVE